MENGLFTKISNGIKDMCYIWAKEMRSTITDEGVLIFFIFVPAFNKDIRMKVFYIKDQGSYAVWKATKTTGQYDLKTFEVKARPIDKLDGLRPGMSLIKK